MLRALSKVLVFQACGAAIAAIIGFPVPGAVIGLGLLFAYMLQAGHVDEATSDLFDRLSPHIPLLFVPAGVGMVGKFDLSHAGAITIVVAVSLGTLATLATTALIADLLFRSTREVQSHG